MALVIFTSITGVFALLILVKNIVRRDFCVLCASVSITWLLLLLFYWLHYISSPVFIAVLIGESVVGVFYLLERKVKEEFLVFRLPFFLTLTFGAFVLLAPSRELVYAGGLIVMLWFVFITVYFLRGRANLGRIVKKIIECCKKW